MTPAPAKNWFEIRNVSESSADVSIYNEIGGFGIAAGDFISQIKDLRVSTLNVRINSPGGSVFDGFAIYNALCSHAARKVVIVEGIAASIASVIAMAGDEIRVCSNALIMIHNPQAVCRGDAQEMRATADLLDKLAVNIAAIYSARSGLSAGDAAELMAEETWLDAKECLAKGLCTVIEPAKSGASPVASLDLSGFRNVPAALSAAVDTSASVSASAPSNMTTPETVVSVDTVAITEVAPVAVVVDNVAPATANAVAPVAPAIDPQAAITIADLTAKLNSAAAEIVDLKAKLEKSETLSAANIGVVPIANVVTSGTNGSGLKTPADLLNEYRALTGEKRQKFFEENKAAIWAAYDDELTPGR